VAAIGVSTTRAVSYTHEVPRSRVSHAVWAGRYLAPWVLRRLRGVSSGDGITAKRPTLQPFRHPPGTAARSRP
jgi:hypothetical protein